MGHQKLDEALVEKIVQFIRLGNYVSVACAACGISEQAFYKWLRNARASIDQYGEDVDNWPDGVPDIRRLEVSMVQSLQVADAEAEAYAVGQMRKHMEKNWQAAATWLERRHGARWRRRIAVDADPVDDEQQRMEQDALSNPDAVAAMHRALVQEALPQGVEEADVVEDDEPSTIVAGESVVED